MKNENETVLKTNEGRVKTDNELIAQFMGSMIVRNYHAWETLMPVVVHIHMIKGSHIIIRQTGCEIFMWGKLISGFGYESMKESIYQAVVEFIKWYNSERGS